VHVAWNSPLARVDTKRRSKGACRAIAMRHTDRDGCTHIIANKSAGIAGLGDLKGQTRGSGAKDSPQARLIPIQLLHDGGLKDGDYTAKRFDVLVGKHGDHIGGELDAFKALEAGDVDASCLLDLNWEGWTKDGTINSAEYGIVATTAKFDHCVLTVLESFAADREKAFLDALFAMTY